MLEHNQCDSVFMNELNAVHEHEHRSTICSIRTFVHACAMHIYICLLNDSRVVSHSLCSSVILFAVALLRPRFVRLSLTATTTPVPFAYKTQTQISKAHSNTHNTARQYLSCVKVIINTYAITAFICNS